MSWNRPCGKQDEVGERSRQSRVYLKAGIAAAFVVIGGLAVLLLLSRSDNQPVEESKGTQGKIKSVKPASAPTNAVAKAEPKIPYWKGDSTNGLSKMQMMKWRFHHRPPARWTNNTSRTQGPAPYEIFKYNSENEIAALISVEPGMGIVGNGNYGERFRQDFLQPLKEPIIPLHDDLPEHAELKRRVNEVKIELKGRMDAGEDLGDILTQARNDLRKMAETKKMIEKDLRELNKKGDMTVEDLDTYVEAANKLLESKGVAPLKLSPLMRKLMERHCKDYVKPLKKIQE